MLVFLALGLALRLLGVLADGSARTLDTLVVDLALPGLILAVVPRLDLGPSLAIPVVVAWTSIVVGALAVLGLARIFGWSRAVVGAMLLVVPLGNTSFLGFPMVELLLGRDHLPHAVIFDQLGSFLALATYGSLVAARYGEGSRGSVLRSVVTFPPFVALVVALVLRGTGTPPLVAEIAERLGDLVIPLAMIAVGTRLRLPRLDSGLAPLLSGLAVSMAVLPGLAFLAAELLGDGGRAWDTSVLEVAMPPMVTASVVAIDAGLDAEVAANLVGVGVLVALLSLPWWAGLL